MIHLVKRGDYTLLETKHRTKVLSLDNKEQYAWIHAKGIGDVLVRSRKKHHSANILAAGKYRVCDVENEPGIADSPHLELSLGNGRWQGYLLLNGLPKYNDKNRIIPTDEIIIKPTINHPAN